MKLFAVMLGVTVFLCLGYSIGLSAYCSQVHGLQRAQKHVGLILAYLTVYPFFLIFVCKKDDKLQALRGYLTLPNKGTVFAIIFEDLLARDEGKAYNCQKEPSNVSVTNIGKNMFSRLSTMCF